MLRMSDLSVHADLVCELRIVLQNFVPQIMHNHFLVALVVFRASIELGARPTTIVAEH